MLISLILFSGLLPFISLPPSLAHADQSNLSLSIAQVPPNLPADGNTYPAIVVTLLGQGNQPVISVNDTIVYLTSSQQNVGTVPSTVKIPAGKSYAIANFTTTSIPGITTVTAQSVGIASASYQVQTVTPSGFPTHLRVYPVPSSQLAQPVNLGSLVVEMVDDAGLPAKAVSTTTITLSSANTAIVSFPQSTVTIPQGAFMTISVYQSGLSTGTTSVTASASGFYSGSSQVSVVGVSPLALHLYLTPSTMPDHMAGRLVIALTDQQGNPARAPYPVQVTITASNTTVVYLPSQVVIPTGNISVMVNYNTLWPGTTSITVAAQNLAHDTEQLQVMKALKPLSLQLSLAPNPVVADRHTYSSIIVALVNGSSPAITPYAINVNLTSQNLAVGNVTPTVTIPAGSSSAIANFTSTFFVGQTTITAQSSGLVSSSMVMNTFGPIPSQVMVSAVPATLPADGNNYTALAVTLEDPSGNPAIAPINVAVQLSSSNPSIITSNSTVVIPAGQSYAITLVKTTLSPGSSTITATSPGYSGSSVTINTVQPGATKLGIYLAPNIAVHLASGDDILIAVQLQDSNGNPARARTPTMVTVTSSSSSLLSKPLQLVIPLGQTYAYTPVTFNDPGSSPSSTTLTASSQGFSSSSMQVTVNPFPLTSSVSSPVTQLELGGSTSVLVSVMLQGQGVQGASIKWSSPSCVVTPQQQYTSSSGTAQATISSCTAGTAVVTATISSPTIGTVQKTLTLTVMAPQPKPSPLQILFSFPYVLILAGIIVLAVLIILVFFRRTSVPENF